MRRFLTSLFVLAVMFSSTVLGEDGPTIVEDGQPCATIVVPVDANQGEQRAAEELQAYVEKASGARLPIATEAAGTTIVLGRACPAVANQPSGDGFTIEIRGESILIAGGNQRGTLYGVYALLEDQLGIRWYMPDEIGEVVPRAKTIRLGAIDRRERPDFEYRWIGRGSEWSARTRNNVGLPEIGINIFGSAHTFRTFLDPAQYFDEHPDWFALVGGQRPRSARETHGNQICTSNPEAIREVIKNIRAFLDENPETDAVTLFPNDGNRFCECADCKALDEPGWATVEEINRHGRAAGLNGYGTLSRRLMIFNNTVARAIYQTHPDVMVKVGAYSCYTNPPKDTSLKYFKNVIVQICHSWCHNHAITDPDCPINADFRRAIEGWTKITPGGVMLYEYYSKVAECELPFPIIHAMRKDIPYFKSIGVKGIYTQYAGNWGTLTLPYYVPTRLLWDVEADVDQVVDDFYHAFYGPAAAPMKRYYERLERAAIDSDLHFSAPYYRFPEIFTAECLDDCTGHLEEAMNLADTKTIRRRLAMVETSLRYTKLVMDYVNAVRGVDSQMKAFRWRLERDADVFEKATGKAELVRQFMLDPPARNVIRQSTNYTDRLLNPEYTFNFRWDRTDPRSQRQTTDVGLTKRQWLASVGRQETPDVPDTFDLWIYGHDFDTSKADWENDVYFVDDAGQRKPIGPLPPEGQACNRAVGCAVYRDLTWPDQRRDVLRLEIVNRPGNWESSTLLAIYVMPAGLDVSPNKAGQLIRSDPDWPRARSIGFTEFEFSGLVNREAEPSRIEVELVGPSAPAR